VEELGLECEIIKITDTNEIVGRGVMMTPALVLDGDVKTIGKGTSVKEIKAILSDSSKQESRP